MKRADKIALLSKIIQGQISPATRQQIRQSNGPGTAVPGAVVIIYKLEAPNPGPTDEVIFYHKGQQVTMPYKDIQAFTRYEPLTVCFIPDNGRMQKPNINDNEPATYNR
jgi:hypothetical protein